MFFSRAEISDIRLDENQWQRISELPVNESRIDSMLSQKAVFGLEKLSDSDLVQILRIIHLNPVTAEGHAAVVYNACRTVSDRMLEGEWSELSFPDILKGSGARYARANLQAYFQNQLFDFYYGNGLGTYLENPEYMALLEPAAVYKLLKDFRTEDRLIREIRFIIRNSDFELFHTK